MWGNNNIKDLDIWGFPEITVSEVLKNNIVYCMFIIDKPMVKEYTYNDKIDVGYYLLNALPNYTYKNNKLILVPETIEVNDPPFTDLDTDTFNKIVYGDLEIAKRAIELYETRDVNKIIEFWNSVDLDIPYMWSKLARIICEKNYAAKKNLTPKYLKHDYLKCKPLVHNVNIGTKYKYLHYHDEYFRLTSTIPNNKKFTLNFIKHYHIKNYIFEEFKNITLYGFGYYDDVCRDITFKHNDFNIELKRFFGSDWYIVVDSNKKLVFEPVKSIEINLHPVSGFIKNTFKIKCPGCDIKTNLDILASRSEYFKTFKNSEIGNKNKIDSQWDLSNFVTFILDTECTITKDNFLTELKIADYYKCQYYTTYIHNWLKVNDLRGYYLYIKRII